MSTSTSGLDSGLPAGVTKLNNVTTNKATGTITLSAKTDKLPASFEPIADVVTVYRKELDALRAKVPAELKSEADTLDDIVLYRFFRGHKFSVDTASVFLNKSVAWRKANNMNALRESTKHLTQYEYPFADKVHRACSLTHSHGRDKFGQPLSIERMGKCKTDLLTKIMTVEELRKYHLVNLEKKFSQLADDTKRTGKVMRFSKIVDLEGLSAKHIDREAFKYLQMVMAEGQANYPEVMGHIYLVNVPWIFKVIWGMVKPFMAEASIAKMSICGDDWKEVLAQDFDKATLPVFLGGTCECKGGCIPEVEPDAGYTAQTLKAGASFERRVTVGAGALVSYEFRTRAYDVGFKIERVPLPTAGGAKAAAPMVIRAHIKVDSGAAVQSASLPPATEAGVYVFTWDNVHSWMYSKELLWRVDVREATDGLTSPTTAAALTAAAAAANTTASAPPSATAAAPSAAATVVDNPFAPSAPSASAVASAPAPAEQK